MTSRKIFERAMEMKLERGDLFEYAGEHEKGEFWNANGRAKLIVEAFVETADRPPTPVEMSMLNDGGRRVFEAIASFVEVVDIEGLLAIDAYGDAGHAGMIGFIEGAVTHAVKSMLAQVVRDSDAYDREVFERWRDLGRAWYVRVAEHVGKLEEEREQDEISRGLDVMESSRGSVVAGDVDRIGGIGAARAATIAVARALHGRKVGDA